MCDCQQTTAVKEQELTLPIPADQVSYDNTLGLLPPGTDNVQEAIEELASAPGVPSMLPTLEGIAYGLTRSAQSDTSLGYDSLTTFASQSPINGSIQENTIVGSLNLSDLSQDTVIAQQNALIGSANFTAVGTIENYSGNFLAGFNNQFVGIREATENILIGMGAGAYSDLFVGRDFARSNTAITTALVTYNAGQDIEAGSVVLGNTSSLNTDERSICIGAGNTCDHNGVSGVLISQGSQPFTNNGFAGCFSLLGSQTYTPTQVNQFGFSHTSMRAPNLSSLTATTVAQRLVIYDTTTGLMSHASPLGNIRRLYSVVRTTNASGDVSLDLTPLGLTLVPEVTATVVQASGTVYYGVKCTAVSTTTWTGRVFNSVNVVLASPSMAPSGSGVNVHIHVSY